MKHILLLIGFLMTSSLTLVAQTKTKPKWNPATEALLHLTVTNFKNIPQANELLLLTGVSSGKKYTATSNKSGKCDVIVLRGDVYEVMVQAIGDDQQKTNVTIPAGPDGEVEADLNIQFELPMKITLTNVLFESGKAVLQTSSYKSLNELALFMKRKVSMEIRIEGYTDDVGEEQANKILSQNRAETVMKYLVGKGIAARRMSALGKGEEEPVASNDTEAGRRKNRRTEIHIVNR